MLAWGRRLTAALQTCAADRGRDLRMARVLEMRSRVARVRGDSATATVFSERELELLERVTVQEARVPRHRANTLPSHPGPQGSDETVVSRAIHCAAGLRRAARAAGDAEGAKRYEAKLQLLRQPRTVTEVRACPRAADLR